MTTKTDSAHENEFNGLVVTNQYDCLNRLTNRWLNDELGGAGYDTSQSYGFTLILQEDGTLEVQWFSRSVNQANFNSPYVPVAARPQIIQVLQNQTGKTVSKQ